MNGGWSCWHSTEERRCWQWPVKPAQNNGSYLVVIQSLWGCLAKTIHCLEKKWAKTNEKVL